MLFVLCRDRLAITVWEMCFGLGVAIIMSKYTTYFIFGLNIEDVVKLSKKYVFQCSKSS